MIPLVLGVNMAPGTTKESRWMQRLEAFQRVLAILQSLPDESAAAGSQPAGAGFWRCSEHGASGLGLHGGIVVAPRT